jgi:hypothetical protein
MLRQSGCSNKTEFERSWKDCVNGRRDLVETLRGQIAEETAKRTAREAALAHEARERELAADRAAQRELRDWRSPASPKPAAARWTSCRPTRSRPPRSGGAIPPAASSARSPSAGMPTITRRGNGRKNKSTDK